MKKLVRTTITIPEDLYKQAKIQAAALGESFSSYLTVAVEEKIRGKGKKRTFKDPFKALGRLSLGIKGPYKNRKELYDDYLKRKMGV